MKIIVNTSNKHLHLIPIFEYLYMKYWGDANIEIVGYEKPVTNLPFVSLGTQGSVKEWSTDLRKYFEKQEQFFIWIFEDSFIKGAVPSGEINNVSMMGFIATELVKNIGRVDLTNDVQKREHSNDGVMITAHPNSRYRLSTQPSIWNKDFLLKYLTDGLDPWTFETQDPKNDGWNILGFINPPLQVNEGVRRFDIHKLNLDSMCQEDIDYIKTITDKW